jgi:hypothetical protein
LGLGVLGFRDWDLRFMVYVLGFKVWEVQGLGFRVKGSGFRA